MFRRIAAAAIIAVLAASLSRPLAFAAESANGGSLPVTHAEPADCYDMNVLLDPDADRAIKQSHVRALQAEADAGNANSRYLLGTFYRLGEKHPAKIFPVNIDQAKKYSSNAAVAGNYAAMAAMAEMELADKNYRAAMLWAQVYAYFSKQEDKKSRQKSSFAYEASLLARIAEGAKKLDKPLLDADFMADFDNFFKLHASTINAYHERKTGKYDVSEYVCKSAMARQFKEDQVMMYNKDVGVTSEVAKLMPAPGYAYYLLSINGEGKISNIAIVDSLPDERYGNALLPVVKTLLFNKSGQNSLRQAYLPMKFDDRSIRLKKRR